MAKKTTIDNSPEGLDHDDDFDGVKELNNPAPNWIILVFLATIGFSLIYAIHYFGYPGNAKDQASEYAQSITAADKANAAKPSAGGAASQNESEMLASGATLFTQKGCIACHGVKGEGNPIGPNLTDNYWLNGCSLPAINKMVAEGKPEKGMTPFKTMMTPDEIQSVSLFIAKKLVGSNPANGKAAQGVECKP
ncbi:MAG: c-type cytochrome [Bacteroidia bacterium]|nr:c-type cytochrome [Bacteroidia bacterium]